jgi:hypothetical protein
MPTTYRVDWIDDVIEIGERRFIVSRTWPPRPSWFFYEIDADGDQIGEVEYAHYKKDLMARVRATEEAK